MYGLEIFREDVKLFKVGYIKFRDDRPICSQVIFGNPVGVQSLPLVPARVNA